MSLHFNIYIISQPLMAPATGQTT